MPAISFETVWTKKNAGPYDNDEHARIRMVIWKKIPCPLNNPVIFPGNYSCLVAQFYLSRSVGFHLVQSYLPTMLIVVISWVSFWMDVDSVPGRTTLGVTTLLAVGSQSSGTVYVYISNQFPMRKNRHVNTVFHDIFDVQLSHIRFRWGLI